MTSKPSPSAERGSASEVEDADTFQPRFDASGLIAAIASDARTGEVLMLAWMNAEALERTISTRIAHFYSRSRGRIWMKGEESGNRLEIVEMRTDCDQDAVWLRVNVAGAGVACHTGAPSCFYRRIALDGEPPGAVGLTRL